MRCIINFVPVATLETVYKGLVQPYFEYCSPLWDARGKLLKDKLQRVQSRAARVLKGASHDTRSADLIDFVSWQTLDDRRRCAKSILMHKILNDHTAPGLRNSFGRKNVDQTNNHLSDTATDLTLTEQRVFRKKY